MNNKLLFRKYKNQLVFEGIIKSLIFGLIIGFSASIIPAIIVLLINSGFWTSLRNYNALGLIIGIGIVIAAAGTVLFYFIKFRPTSKQLAARLDRLGYKERFITREELINDESYIAMLQREDAIKKLKANRKRIKLSFFVVPFVIVAILCTGSVMAITAAAVAYSEEIMWYDNYDPDAPKEGDLLTVKYEAGEGGFIYGVMEQEVLFGNSASTIVAVANEGYAFARWVEGRPPELVRWSERIIKDEFLSERTDTPVSHNIYLIAEFVEIHDGYEYSMLSAIFGGNFLMSAMTANASVASTLSASVTSTASVSAAVAAVGISAASAGLGGGTDSDPPPDDSRDSPPPEDPPDNANNIIDGEVYYRDVYDVFFAEALQKLIDSGEIPEHLKKIVEAYFTAIV